MQYIELVTNQIENDSNMSLGKIGGFDKIDYVALNMVYVILAPLDKLKFTFSRAHYRNICKRIL